MSMTCDGAAVMVSQKSGVAGKMKSINPKIFITHIVPPPPHRLVLTSKASQKQIPDEVEKLVSDTLFFFKDSPVRFKLQELVEPGSTQISISQSSLIIFGLLC